MITLPLGKTASIWCQSILPASSLPSLIPGLTSSSCELQYLLTIFYPQNAVITRIPCYSLNAPNRCESVNTTHTSQNAAHWNVRCSMVYSHSTRQRRDQEQIREHKHEHGQADDRHRRLCQLDAHAHRGILALEFLADLY